MKKVLIFLLLFFSVPSMAESFPQPSQDQPVLAAEPQAPTADQQIATLKQQLIEVRAQLAAERSLSRDCQVALAAVTNDHKQQVSDAVVYANQRTSEPAAK